MSGLGLGWSLKSLLRRPLRTTLSVAGIAISAAMLLDMVMLSGGIERSFAELLLARGYQIRLTPKGTLPFDTEASVSGAGRLIEAIRRDSSVEAAGAVLGTSLHSRMSDSLVTLFGYGIQPEAQGLYTLESGRDIRPADTLGVLLSVPAATLLQARVGDTISLIGRLDPQVVTATRGRDLVVRGIVRWAYDYRGQPSVGTVLPVMQALAGQRQGDRASLLMVKVRNDDAAERVAERLRAAFPQLEVNSVADLVRHFKQRLVYFRQLAYILASMSLAVTVLLIGTLLTITVNERLGEIATLRAIGISRFTVVREVLVEGAALTLFGSVLGICLGLATARYLDAILTSFPGLPAAFSFFVPRRESLTLAASVLLLTGGLAALYPAWLAARAPIAATLRAEAT
ncbi:MAG TPA: FtsX-like permease family protein [Gemmatimonadales bacterium]|nr:FtsX-like permease family protein [Gemmatimonadales bacterium]